MKPLLAGSVAAAALGATAHALPAVTAVGPVRRLLWPRLAGVGLGNRIALTFDDGPDGASTPLFLRVLEQSRVRATFFLLGNMLDRDPCLGRELVSAGHEVGVHGWEHRNPLWQSPAATYTDIARTRDLVASVTGVLPVWYRPPYGVLTAAALLACRRLNLVPRLWTTWGRDWDSRSPESIWQTITKDLDGGGTVLLHDSDCASAPGSWRGSLMVLPRLIEWADRQSLTIGTLGAHCNQDR